MAAIRYGIGSVTVATGVIVTTGSRMIRCRGRSQGMMLGISWSVRLSGTPMTDQLPSRERVAEAITFAHITESDGDLLQDIAQAYTEGRLVDRKAIDLCEHGYVREHLVDYWWRNDTDAGAEWCDGVPGGRRVEDLADVKASWNADLQRLDWWESAAAIGDGDE